MTSLETAVDPATPFDPFHPSTAVRTANLELRSASGEVVFRRDAVSIPEQWSDLAAAIAAKIYLRPDEASIPALIRRIVETVCSAGPDAAGVATVDLSEALHALLWNQAAAFSSPVWMNAGRRVAPSSCHALTLRDETSLDSLLPTLRQALESGAGCGVNLSALPSVASASGLGLAAAIRLIADMARPRETSHARAPSVLFLLDIVHADVLSFCDPRWRAQLAGPHCLFGLRLSDDFMESASDGTQERLLECIATSIHVSGQPVLQFADTINETHTCPASGDVRSSNPCSEFVFLDDTAALLASLNLARFFSSRSHWDVAAFCRAVDVLAESLDRLVDYGEYPTSRISSETRAHRPFLIGLSNLSATLRQNGIPYDSAEGRSFAAHVSSLLTATAYRKSAQLARARGAFEQFAPNRTSMLRVIERHASACEALSGAAIDSPAMGRALHNLRARALEAWSEALRFGREWGVRNAQVSAIAPTGTISHVMDCVSTGIEPLRPADQRMHLTSGAVVQARHDDRFVVHEPLDEHAVPLAQLSMASSIAPHVSGGISSTVIVDADAGPELIFTMIVEAWKQRLKGVALYRDGSLTNQPIRKATISTH